MADPTTAAGASVTDAAAASLAAIANSLNEVSTKLTSVTESISKVVEGIAGQTSTSDSARSIDNVHSVGSVEAVMADLVESSRRSRNWFDKQIADVLQHDNDVRSIITAGLRNSAESDNMVAKQAVRHADTQLFNTAMGEAAEVDVATGAVVNDLLAAVQSLKASADALAKTVTPKA